MVRIKDLTLGHIVAFINVSAIMIGVMATRFGWWDKKK